MAEVSSIRERGTGSTALNNGDDGPDSEEFQQVQNKRKAQLQALVDSHYKRFLKWYIMTGLISAWVASIAIALWSQIGWGAVMFQSLIKQEGWLNPLAGSGVLILLSLYMLDFFTAPHLAQPGQTIPHCIMGQTSINRYATIIGRGIFLIGFCIGLMYCFLSAKTRPHYPVSCTLVLFILLQVALRLLLKPAHIDESQIDRLKDQEKGKRGETIHRILMAYLEDQIDTLTYYKAVSCSTLCASTAVLCYFLTWAFITPRRYWPATRQDIEYYGVDITDVPNLDQLFNIHFNIWIAPAFVAIAYLLFFFMFTLRCYLHVAYTRTDDLLQEISAIFVNQDDEAAAGIMGVGSLERLVDIVKISFAGFVALGLGVWLVAEIGTGIADSALNISQIVRDVLFTFAVCYTIFVVASMQRLYQQMCEEMWRNPFLKLMVDVIRSDWLKAIFLLLFWWGPPFYYLFSACNKLVRKCRGIKDNRYYSDDAVFLPEPYGKYVTRRVSNQLGKAAVIGIVVWILNVGFTLGLNLFLIWINSWLPSNPWVALIIWYILGLCCFLLPPVPGPPVYLFGGIVVVDAFQKQASSSTGGFWFGIGIVSFFSWFLKLNACAMQQKCIGEPLGSSDTVRRLVGIHRPFIRAIEIVLKQPGLSMGKVAILCGGPDWPTSVLCGILRCRLIQIMIGTTPIFFFVVPTVCTGAFKRQQDELFTTLTSLFLMLSLLFSLSFGIAASFGVQEVLDNHGPLLQIPLERNKKLDWGDYVSNKKSEIYTRTTAWNQQSLFCKTLIILAFLMQSGQSYLFYWYSTDAFGDVEQALIDENIDITFSKSDAENDSNLILVVKDLGLYGNYVFFLGCLIFYVWTKLLNGLAAVEIAELEKRIDEEYAEWEVDLIKKRDQLEKEMQEFYPDDYEVYLLQTGRPPLEGYHWVANETIEKGIKEKTMESE